MPVTLTIDREQRVVYSAFLGRVSEEEFLGQPDRIRSHPSFDPTLSDIVDFSTATDLNISDEAIGILASRESIFAKEAIHIVVVPRGFMSRLAATFQALTNESRPNFVVVHTPTQAYDYLRQHSANTPGRI